MNAALSTTFGHLEGQPLVMADLTLALNNFLLTSQFSTGLLKQQEQLRDQTTVAASGSAGSADANPPQGGVNQGVAPANAAAVAAGVQAALAGNPQNDPMDVNQGGPKRGAGEMSKPQDKEGDSVLDD